VNCSFASDCKTDEQSFFARKKVNPVAVTGPLQLYHDEFNTRKPFVVSIGRLCIGHSGPHRALNSSPQNDLGSTRPLEQAVPNGRKGRLWRRSNHAQKKKMSGAPPPLPEKSAEDRARQEDLAKAKGGPEETPTGDRSFPAAGGESGSSPEAAKKDGEEAGSAESEASKEEEWKEVDKAESQATSASGGDSAKGDAASDTPVKLPPLGDQDGSWRGYPKCGVFSAQGRRKTMEDTHVLSTVERKGAENEVGADGQPGDTLVFAVFDGHGGDQVALLCEEYLISTLSETEAFWGDDEQSVLNGFTEAFAAMDGRIVQRATDENWIAGSTAVVCALRFAEGEPNPTLYVGNLGDSESSLGVRLRKGSQDPPFESMVVSLRHKPGDTAEKKRIGDAGGHVVFGRINGALAVSRAFGDKDFKLPKCGTKKDLVTCEPFVHAYKLEPQHEFLVLACDGLWDVFSHDDVAKAVGAARASGRSAQEVSEKLVEKALQKGSTDNISVIVIYFPTLTEQEPEGWRQRTLKGVRSRIKHAALHAKGGKHDSADLEKK
jgi:serine/threonine protein phosphatase PrpC